MAKNNREQALKQMNTSDGGLASMTKHALTTYFTLLYFTLLLEITLTFAQRSISARK